MQQLIIDKNGCKLKLPIFEGPFDLLLHLIKKNKIDIYNIPIAKITGEYLRYIDMMKDLNLEIAGEFLVMSATLIQIKTKMLLPTVEKDQQISNTQDDPRTELVNKLVEYQVIKFASEKLKERYIKWSNHFYRNSSIFEEDNNYILNIEIIDLLNALKKVLQRSQTKILSIKKESLTVKEKMDYIIQKLEEKNIILFEEVFSNSTKSHSCLLTEKIVTFLALLELLRLGTVKVYQDKIFGQIWIFSLTHFQTQKKNYSG